MFLQLKEHKKFPFAFHGNLSLNRFFRSDTFSLCLQLVDSDTENLISDRASDVRNSRYKRNIVDVEILDFSHDPTKCAGEKSFVWCVQSDYNREKHPYACKYFQTIKPFF